MGMLEFDLYQSGTSQNVKDGGEELFHAGKSVREITDKKPRKKRIYKCQ